MQRNVKKKHSKLNFACINYAAEQLAPREVELWGWQALAKGAYGRRNAAWRGAHIPCTTRASVMFALGKETPK